MTELTARTRSQYLARLALRRPSLRGLRVAEFEGLDDLAQLVEQVLGTEGAEAAPDLSGLTAEDLTQLRAALAAAYAEVRPGVETDEQVEALRTVAEAIARVDGELAARETAATEREAQLAELDQQVAAEDGGEGSGDGEGGSGSGEGSGDGSGEGDGAEGSGSGDGEGSGEGEGGSGSGEGEGEGGDGAAQASAVPARRPPLAVLAGARRQRAAADADGAANEVVPEGIRFRDGARVVAAAVLPDIGTGEAFESPDRLGQSIARMADELRVSSPTDRKFYLGRVLLPARPHVVRLDDFRGEDEASVLDEAARRNVERKVAAAQAVIDGDDRRTASGGVCVPAQPDYTITVVGDRGTPFIDSLPTVQGNRPLSYFPWINLSLRDTPGSRVGARPASGFGTVTAAQDAAGYGTGGGIPEGGHAYKDCVRIDCPSPVSESPEASFLCTTVGNFQAITFPEYVRAFDQITGSYFDVYRDERSLAKVVAAAKVIQGNAGPTFGAARDLLDVIRRLVAHVRSVRNAPGMAFTVAVPRFARYMIAQDLAFSWAAGTDNLRISAAQALAYLAVDEGIFIDEYGVSIGNTAGGSPTVLPELSTGDDLPDWPEELRLLVYPEGGVFRHDYGELSFGLRETGVQTNDFSAFMEVFEQTATRTTDIFALDVPLCVNGLMAGAIAKTCGGDVPIVVGGEAAASRQLSNEVQTVDPGDSTGGSYTLTFDGETTAAIAYNASAATVKTRLEALSNVQPGDVVTSKTGTKVAVQFTGQYAGEDVPTLVADSTSLTGGAHTATVAVVQEGGA